MATTDKVNGAKAGEPREGEARIGETRAPEMAAAGNQSISDALSASAPYQIHLPSFDGPLDLLLHLIERRQMEITTLSLVAVTDQFLEYVRTFQGEEPPMARLAEFITVGAKLLFIKSRSLLPQST